MRMKNNSIMTTTPTLLRVLSLFPFMVLIATTTILLPATKVQVNYAVDAFIVSPQTQSSTRPAASTRPTATTTTTRIFATTSNIIGNDIEKEQQNKNDNNAASASASVVIVLGGSGYIGRRVCKELVLSSSTISNDNDNANNKVTVISISRSGKPPLYYLDDNDKNNDSDNNWSNQVEWIEHDLLLANNDDDDDDVVVNKDSLLTNKILQVLETITIEEVEVGVEEKEGIGSGIDLTVVGCIGKLSNITSKEKEGRQERRQEENNIQAVVVD